MGLHQRPTLPLGSKDNPLFGLDRKMGCKKHAPMKPVPPNQIMRTKPQTDLFMSFAQHAVFGTFKSFTPASRKIKPTRPGNARLMITTQNNNALSDKQDEFRTTEVLHDPAFCPSQAGCTLQ